MVEIFLANEQPLSVDESRLTALARHTLTAETVAEGAELSILLVTAEHIRRLNSHFAGDDHATDVLAFPMMEDDEEEALLLGDVVVCPKVAQGNADRAGISLSRELDMLVVHGTLHLLGYDHQDQQGKRRMERRLHDLLESFTASAV
jgi:probable rRNA maturation factor